MKSPHIKGVTITINTTGAAFADFAEHEIARILSNLATKFRDDNDVYMPQTLRDTNGNTCGTVVIEWGPEE